MVDYLRERGPREGHLFIFEDQSPLTKSRFTKHVKAALIAVGVADYECYTGHSFRVGAATAAAQAGIPDSTIKALGRWNSGAFLVYVRWDRKTLAAVTHQLAGIC